MHTPETFAKIFCDDLSIPIVPYAEQVADMVRGQIEENQGLAEIEVIPDVGAEVTADDVAVFDGGEVLEPEKLKRKAQESDCRIIINVRFSPQNKPTADADEPSSTSRSTCTTCAIRLNGI